MTNMNVNTKKFHRLVVNWYKKHGRKNLPWQQCISPYRVWLSEIMLQQTQVTTVIPYFEKFIKRFPTIQQLAKATLDEVNHLWAGLGYYSRARNLHKTAQIVHQQYNNKFPSSLQELMLLPGIGRSTAGAILSLSMEIPAPILDGNVKRVLSRVFAIAGWPEERAAQKRLWELATYYTPAQQVKAYTQAMMDLGAMVCTKSNPQCIHCPLIKICQARQLNQINLFPGRKPKISLPIKSTYLLIIANSEQAVLLEKRAPVGIWGGLWSLPECQELKDLKTLLKQRYGLLLKKHQAYPNFRHSFTHFHLEITPVLIEASLGPKHQIAETNRIWYKETTNQLGLPKPVSQLMRRYAKGELTWQK